MAIETLVSLPHTSPSLSLANLRMQTLAHTPSTRSHRGAKEILEDIDLDEVIPILKFDLETLTLEKIQIL